MSKTFYMYVCVRRDMPSATIAVQAAHACIESTKAFPAQEHPHLVFLTVRDEADLQRNAAKLVVAGIQHVIFTEPDRQNEATALATAPISGEARRVFRNYRLLI